MRFELDTATQVERLVFGQRLDRTARQHDFVFAGLNVQPHFGTRGTRSARLTDHHSQCNTHKDTERDKRDGGDFHSLDPGLFLLTTRLAAPSELGQNVAVSRKQVMVTSPGNGPLGTPAPSRPSFVRFARKKDISRSHKCPPAQ